MEHNIKHKIKRIFILLWLIPLLSNLLGALSIFLYLSYLEVDAFTAAVTGGSERMSEFVRWHHFIAYFLAANFLGLGLFMWWFAPVKRYLKRAAQGKSLGEIPDSIRHRALAVPLMLATATAGMWLGAGFYFWYINQAAYEMSFLDIGLPIIVVAGVPVVIFNYILVELDWRYALPIFFPEGNVPEYSTGRITLRKRVFLIGTIITYLPLLMFAFIGYERAKLLALTGDSIYLTNLILSYLFVGFVAFLMIELGFFSIWKIVLLPVQQLQTAFERVGQAQDLTTRLPVMSNDELGVAAQGFNRMVEGLIRGQEAERERDRIAYELELARQTQQSLLPREMPRLRYLDIMASSEPAFEVGGDFYGYYLLPDNSLAITVGDVSGKGMAAALMMAVATGHTGSFIYLMHQPSQFLASLNEATRPHTRQSGLNVALCALHLAANGRGLELEAANAGGVWPIVRRTGGRVEWLEVSGPPLGMIYPTVSYGAISTALRPGDLLILSSDGVIEAHNPRGELFGFDRLEEAVAGLDATQPVAALHQELLGAVQSFTNDAPLYDDLTLMALKVV